MSINVFLCFLNALNYRRRRYCRLHFRRIVFVSWRRINLQAHAPTDPDYFINVRSDHVSWSAKREVVQETKPQVRLQGFRSVFDLSKKQWGGRGAVGAESERRRREERGAVGAESEAP